MSVKRPLLDLKALTAEMATPMPEAVQRAAPSGDARSAEAPARAGPRLVVAPTENFHGLAFKVSPGFRRRFRSRAAAADLKLNELLFEALDAWEEKRGFK